jgi:putative heme-binding domain-containing protein
VADIAALTGDAKRGASLVAACFLCHRIGDNGVDYGPNLTAFAKMQTPEVVIGAIAHPSEDISHGYEGTIVTLKDGKVIHGRVLSDGDPVVVQSTGGVLQLIPAERARHRPTHRIGVINEKLFRPRVDHQLLVGRGGCLGLPSGFTRNRICTSGQLELESSMNLILKIVGGHPVLCSINSFIAC